LQTTIDREQMLCQHRSDEEEGCVAEGEHAFNRGIAVAEMQD
jgi:hypothetical protein